MFFCVISKISAVISNTKKIRNKKQKKLHIGTSSQINAKVKKRQEESSQLIALFVFIMANMRLEWIYTPDSAVASTMWI